MCILPCTVPCNVTHFVAIFCCIGESLFIALLCLCPGSTRRAGECLAREWLNGSDIQRVAHWRGCGGNISNNRALLPGQGSHLAWSMKREFTHVELTLVTEENEAVDGQGWATACLLRGVQAFVLAQL